MNRVTKDNTTQSWMIDDERLKNGGAITAKDYFEKQRQKVREIRIAKRRFYQKITDIYITALDYDREAKTSKEFFAKVQNKLALRYSRKHRT